MAIFRANLWILFFELFLGIAGILLEQLPLDFFGDLERKKFVGMPFDSIFEIAEGLSRLHVEGVEFPFGIVESAANVFEVFVRAFVGRHGESVRLEKTAFCQHSSFRTTSISPLFRKRSRNMVRARLTSLLT